MALTPGIVASVMAYFLTSACALLIIRKRFANRRLRLLTIAIGMMPFLLALFALGARGHLLLDFASTVADNIDMFLGLLTLYAVYLLDIESRDRAETDLKLRLVESDSRSAGPYPAN